MAAVLCALELGWRSGQAPARAQAEPPPRVPPGPGGRQQGMARCHHLFLRESRRPFRQVCGVGVPVWAPLPWTCCPRVSGRWLAPRVPGAPMRKAVEAAGRPAPPPRPAIPLVTLGTRASRDGAGPCRPHSRGTPAPLPGARLHSACARALLWGAVWLAAFPRPTGGDPRGLMRWPRASLEGLHRQARPAHAGAGTCSAPGRRRPLLPACCVVAEQRDHG